jgi:hypothetical protein
VTRRILPAALLCLTCTAVGATDVAVVGVFPGKAVLVIDGDGPYTLPVGGSRGAVRLMSVDEGLRAAPCSYTVAAYGVDALGPDPVSMLPDTLRAAEAFETNDPAFGIWRDREDMADVAAYVSTIRAGRYSRDGSRNER